MKAENDTLISAWNHYNIIRTIKIEHVECFDILLKRGVFKAPEQPMPNGKPWQVWYDNLFEKGKLFAVGIAMDQKLDPKEIEACRQGKHKLNETSMKMEALKYYFSKFENEDQIRKSLNSQ